MRLFFKSKSNVFYLGWEEKNNLNIAQKANMRVKQFSNKINYFWIKSLNGGLVFQWRNVRRKKYSVLWVNQNSLEAEKCFIFVYSGFYSTKNSLTELIFSMLWRLFLTALPTMSWTYELWQSAPHNFHILQIGKQDSLDFAHSHSQWYNIKF